MTTFQKIIKYCSIAFGAYLAFIIINILVAIVIGILAIETGLESAREYNKEFKDMIPEDSYDRNENSIFEEFDI